MSHLRKVLLAAVAALAAALAIGAAPATAAAAPTHVVIAGSLTAYQNAHPDVTGPCTDGYGYNGATEFWRCTGSAANARWVGNTCAQGEYNAGTYYNVYGIINNCGTRVWLHEYTYPQDVNNGWAYCSTPYSATALSGPIFPENIMVSANSATCSF